MKAKQLMLIIGLAVGVLNADCQTYIKYFAIDSFSTTAYSMIEKDSFFYVVGVTGDTSNLAAINAYIAKFDTAGNMLYHRSFRPPEYIYYYITIQNGLINTSDGGIAAGGLLVDTTGKDHISFTKFDSTGNFMYYKAYTPNITGYRHTQALNLIELDGYYYLLGSVQLSNYYVAPMVIKIDLLGNLQFIKTYSGFPYLYGDVNTGISSLSDSTLLIAVGRTDGNSREELRSEKTCFLIVDTAGNLLKQHISTDSNTMAYYNVAVAPDGNYLSSGSYFSLRQTGGGYMLNQYLLKSDTSFNKIWEIKHGDLSSVNAFTDFEQDAQGNIILCGQNLDDVNYSSDFLGLITKVDSSGNVIFNRKYHIATSSHPDYNHNYLYDVDLMPNGDIMAVGTWESVHIPSPLTQLQLGWFLRVHADGCMDDGSCGVTTGINDEPQQAQEPVPAIQVFPNPSNGVFSVNTTNDLPVFSIITVYDINGKTIVTQPLFNRVNLLNLYKQPAGMYFYRVSNGLVTSGEGKLVIQK